MQSKAILNIQISYLKLLLFLKKLFLNLKGSSSAIKWSISIVLVLTLVMGQLAFPVSAENNNVANIETWIGSNCKQQTNIVTNAINTVKSAFIQFSKSSSPIGGGILEAMLNAFTTASTGCETVATQKVAMMQGDNLVSKEVKVTYYTGGLTENLQTFLGTIYQYQPADINYEVDQFMAKVDPVRKVNAQTYAFNLPNGDSYLSIIRGIHGSIQNIVYLFYIIVILFIAFAIMFRKKISGQQYVGIVNSIPRVIISFILVVFSFPIASALIGVGNIGYNLLYDILIQRITVVNNPVAAGCTGGQTAEACLNTQFTPNARTVLSPSSDVMSIFQIFGTSKANNVGTAVSSGSFGILDPDLGSGGAATQLVSSLASMIKNMAGDAFSNASTGATTMNSLLAFVLSVAALFSMFKLFFNMLKEYFVILFSPLSAPFTFAMSAFPGQDKGIKQWFINYISSILSFVAVYGVFLLMILFGSGLLSDKSSSVQPPILGFSGSPTNELILSFVAYALFIIAPMVPGKVKEALKATSDFDKYGQEVASSTRKAVNRVTLGAVG